jgi:hypothetical protein
MIEDLKYYLLVMRIRLQDKEDGELLMTEVSTLAVKNWVDREDGTPDLTREQFNKAIRRVIAKKGMNRN